MTTRHLVEITIVWDNLKAELLDHDTEERMTMYKCIGTGNDGNQYEGTAEFSCGECIGISEIIKLK